MKITLLTLGTRGDVQPYVALGVGLKNAGHNVTVVTAKNFEPLVTAHGLTYGFVDADMFVLAQDMRFRRRMKGNPFALMRQINAVIWQFLRDTWKAARDSEVIVYHPKALGGYHIAEKLGIPAFASAPLPILTPTRAFPNPILPPNLRLGGAFNRLSTSLMLSLVNVLYHGTLNRFRTEILGLPPRPRFASEQRLHGQPIPILYPFSRHVVPIPDDWPEWVHVTGYWFLDEAHDWQPPVDLVRFLEAGPAPVYVGFGSMLWNDPEKAATAVIDALRQTGQRGILASGWGGLAASDLPDNLFMIESAPHDWLFPRVAAVVHHGGAGTTAAGLRAGKPTVICPFFGDQPFWGERVRALGAGPAPIPQARLTADRLASAIQQAVSDPAMRQQAAALGENISAEDGISAAVRLITSAA